MEVVNQIIAFFTPYFGEYARFVPMVIGILLAVLAFVIRRRFVNKMRADIAAAKKKDADAREVEESSSDSPESSTDVQASSTDISTPIEESEPLVNEPAEVAQQEQASLSWAERIKSGLSRTRSGWAMVYLLSSVAVKKLMMT